jgi:MFS family permease
MVLAAGVAAGQVVGGVLVSADLFGTGWRPIFLVNVPVGLGVLAFATGRLPAGSRTERGRLDLGGAGLLAVAMLALLVPLSFGADSGWPAWCWPTLAAGAGLVAWFARHVRRLASQGRAPLIEPSLLGRNGVRVPLGGAFVLMSCYGGVLFTTALYLQSTLHDSALRAGLTFAAYAAGFATASLTWARLPATLHAHVPGAGFALITAATAALALASRGPWHWYATALLAAAGAGHGAGFGALVRRAAARVNRQHAASLSGLLATVNQLAIAIGVATAGTLYVTFIRIGHGAHALSPVLLVVAAVEALSGATVAVLLARRSAISGGRQYRA